MKRKPGRPKKAEEERKVVISVSLERRTVERLRASGNASKLIDELVRLYVDV